MQELNAYREPSPSQCFVSEATKQTSIKFDVQEVLTEICRANSSLVHIGVT
jgi:hypothetical protein